jgi:hypothetical protein
MRKRVYPTEYSFPVRLEGGGWALEFRKLAYPGAIEEVGEPRRVPMQPIDTAPPEVWEKIDGTEPDCAVGWALVDNFIVLLCENWRFTHYFELPPTREEGA